MQVLELNDGQEAAVGAICQWWVKTSLEVAKRTIITKPRFVVAGLAGTGKTTIVKKAIERLNPKPRVVQYLGPTGKSAAVLRRKGNLGAVTLHRFAFICLGAYENDEGDEEPVFVERGALEQRPDLIVLDEASMVGRREMDTLMSFGIPVIALGDQGQLEPVRSAAGIDLEKDADVTLTEIMRQEGESNIIRAASFVREGYVLPERKYKDCIIERGYPSSEMLADWAGLDGYRQIIVAKNNTRREINDEIRSMLGFKGPIPNVGEKIVCRFNDHKRGIMNGEQFNVAALPRESAINGDDGSIWEIELTSLDDGRKVISRFNPMCFMAPVDSEEWKEASRKPGAFDFAYAITGHTSQGSEWPEVMVIDEDIQGVNRAKWRYTVITRASEFLHYYR